MQSASRITKTKIKVSDFQLQVFLSLLLILLDRCSRFNPDEVLPNDQLCQNVRVTPPGFTPFLTIHRRSLHALLPPCAQQL